jgi:hypothetical protein
MDTAHDNSASERLLRDLGAAHAAAAALAGHEPLGVRAVQWAPATRAYLCAFNGPAFLCLASDLSAERSLRRAREIAGTGLLWEHLEALVDAPALRDLAAATGRALALGDAPREVMSSLETLAARAIELADWRDRPERALASLVDIDAATATQERLHAAYGLFVRASDPLVEIQERLDPGLVGALRSVEEAAAAARAAERLTELLARSLAESADGADQVVAAHLTPLSG